MSLGRNSLVGTTVKTAKKLPSHLLGDETHTQWYKDKVYLATPVAEGCILGAYLVKQATESDLTLAYGEFAEESWQLDQTYEPQTVNTDGWKATQKAWQNLYERVQLVLCFLHAALKIRDRSRRLKDQHE